MKHYLFVLAVLFLSCKSGKVEQSIAETYKQTIDDAIGEQWEGKRSTDNDYLLAVQEKKSNPQQPVTEKRFIVLDKSGTKVHEGSINGGYVKWYSETKIEYFNYVGIMPKDTEKEDFIYIYDILDKTTQKKSEISK